ncbi:MAG TPA: hypothetical protein VKI43_00235 [Vicinamibacterales bacterium]|nr:hypothetical protein [Vicinamibacterales bacterium]
MTEQPAHVVISYERFLECQARRRGIAPEPAPHDHSPTSETTDSPALDEAAAAERPRPAPRAGG